MHGYEMLVQSLIADRLREVRHDELVREAEAARKSRNDVSQSVASDVDGRVDDGSWLPRLRGYPIDPFYASTK
jgi:hypothetical protein